jgi:hypothetical protein
MACRIEKKDCVGVMECINDCMAREDVAGESFTGGTMFSVKMLKSAEFEMSRLLA